MRFENIPITKVTKNALQFTLTYSEIMVVY